VLWEAADDADNDGQADGHGDANPANNANLTDNTAALNYGQEIVVEDVALTAALVSPSGGNDPGLTGGTSLSSFASGSGSTNTTQYDEVGIIEISGSVDDNDYLGIGATETAKILGDSGGVLQQPRVRDGMQLGRLHLPR
jgi:MSHA biogenesis protein MshQ